MHHYFGYVMGCVLSLFLGCSMGCTNILLETNSSRAHNLITQGVPIIDSYNLLVVEINNLMNEALNVNLKHVVRG